MTDRLKHIADVRAGAAEPVALSTGLVVAMAASLAAVYVGPLVALVVAVAALVAVVAWRPVLAPLTYLLTLPFLAGIDRGALIPLLRPNEALLAVLLLGAVSGGLIRYLRGARVQLRISRWDVPIAGFFVLAIGWPVSSMLIRGLAPSAADLAALLPACKLAALLLLVRATVRTANEVRWCTRLIVAGAVAISAIAVLQVLNVEPVASLIHTYYPVLPLDLHRASTTLSNPVAAGDYMIIGAVLLLTSWMRGLFAGRGLGVCAVLLAAGLVAAGQFSTWFGALIVAAVLLRQNPSLWKPAVRFAPFLVIAMLVGAPALLDRLGEFSNGDSAPLSWLVRWTNLSTLYLPPLFEHGGFVLGVAVNSVIIPPDSWRSAVYLESGYLQFLWMGGIPLLVGFIWLSSAVRGRSGQLSRRSDGIGACAAALAVVWWMVLILSLFDPHLFMRGPGDLLFVLIGITLSGAVEKEVR